MAAPSTVAVPHMPLQPPCELATATLVEANAQKETDPNPKESTSSTIQPLPIPAVLLEEMYPPENFSPVITNVYRSSFPKAVNFEFLTRLKLKAVVCLISEDYPEENLEFLRAHNIELFQYGMPGNKEPFVKIPETSINKAIKTILDPKNHPVLIHCNRGKHRTGCVVGCIRKLQKWNLTMIFDEYRKFAAPKQRALDQQFIEMFDEEDIYAWAIYQGLLPIKW